MFEVARFNSVKVAFTRKTLVDLDFGVKATENIAQYPLHYVTFTFAKFAVATSYSLGDIFTRK